MFLVTALGILAGCGTGNTSSTADAASRACDVAAPAEPQTVNILAFSAPSIDPFTDAIVKGCSAADNLTLNHTPVDFTGQIQKAQLALGSEGNSPYDVVEVYNSTLVEYASKGWVAPLDDYISKYEDKYQLGDVSEEAWAGVTYDGKIYAVPNQVNTQILIYRKDLFEAEGLSAPTTYEELVAAASKLGGKVDYPLSMAWGSDDALLDGFHGWLAAGGGKWFNDDNTPAFDSPEGRKGLEQMKGLLPFMPKDTLSFGNGDVMGLMQQGKVGMAIIWASRAAPINDPNASKVAGKVGFAPAPRGMSGIPAGENSVDGFAIAKNSAVDPETLFQIVASTTLNKDVQRDASEVVLPARMSVQNDTSAAQPHWGASFENIAGGAQALPAVPFMDPLTKSVVNPFLAKAVTGALPVDAALRQASAALNKTLLDQGHLK
ncbi:ABC transporter substrate-binding protein [Arthrobacter crusticola]|nr:sugar ABC transporter substrate-binding protein [Arthrobacter crusticola]